MNRCYLKALKTDAARSCRSPGLCVEAVEKVPKQILWRDLEESDLIEFPQSTISCLGRGE